MTSPRHLTRCPLSPGTPSHAGKQRKAGYTDQFLVKQGAPVGSTIVMTPTGYMTEEAWLEMAPTIAKGIREMPVIRDRPDWWVLKIIDGFGPHTSSEKAMEIYAAHKVLLLKEDGDTSHVCQMYDQRVARDDKKSMRQSLGYLRQSNKLVKGTIDGWQLVHVALAAVRELDSNSWVYSADKVNLKPSTRVSFQEWCKRISHYLQGGESSFKPEVVRDTYALLSPFWHGMTPDEKKLAIAVVTSHGHGYSIACVKELIHRVHVPAVELQSLRVAVELAMKDPSHLKTPRTSSAASPRPLNSHSQQRCKRRRPRWRASPPGWSRSSCTPRRPTARRSCRASPTPTTSSRWPAALCPSAPT